MSHNSSLQSTSAAMSTPSEAGGPSYRPSGDPATSSGPGITTTALAGEGESSDSADLECPTSPNKNISRPEPVEVFIDALEENPDMPATPCALVVSEWSFDPQFCFDDSNVTVRIEKRQFRVHEFKLKEFENLKSLIEAAQKDIEGRKIIELSGSAEDFHNTLTVLYASTYAPQTCDAATLKSTLRFSAMHNHSQLRAFCIRKLQKLDLSPIERFALSRDCDIGSWMSKALDDLCWKEEPITVEEAEILGTKKFVELAARREDAKFGCGSRTAQLGNLKAPAPVVIAAAKRIPHVPTLRDLPAPTTASTSTASPRTDGLSDISSLSSPPIVPTPSEVHPASTSLAPASAPTLIASPTPTTASTMITSPAPTNTLFGLPSNKAKQMARFQVALTELSKQTSTTNISNATLPDAAPATAEPSLFEFGPSPPGNPFSVIPPTAATPTARLPTGTSGLVPLAPSSDDPQPVSPSAERQLAPLPARNSSGKRYQGHKGRLFNKPRS
ncbi:hypothetical protein BDV93DRAFT_607709 [Ceratobasidium sp. AG-I]|nr:hypothetical protein BDV93DRAFT_607709 [Ceratobasidium sp. AG-I]